MAATPPPPPPAIEAAPSPGTAIDRSRFWKRAAIFLGLGVLLYLGLFLWSENLARTHAQRNRFHQILHREPTHFDYVLLGASHAAVFDYRDMNQKVEQAFGGSVMNLANVGAGITLNRFLLDLFLDRHSTDAVVYILDSFVFYSPEWNEVRIQDVELYRRAPWSLGLAGRLIADPDARGAAVDYLTGFSKINNQNRFGPDLFDAETSTFDRSYRPIPQIDRQRMEFLYPDGATPELLRERPYLEEFVELGRGLQERGIEFIVVRQPIPERIQGMLPNEEDFVEEIQRIASENDFRLLDFSDVNNDREYFYDSDHLNQEGATRFLEDYLGPAISGAVDTFSSSPTVTLGSPDPD